MSYKYILFDLDGTLTDPKEGITKCVQYALADFGIDEPNMNDLLKFIGPPLTDSFHDYYGFDEEQCQRAVKKYRERYKTVGLFENVPLEGADKMLKTLKDSGKILAVATSKPEPFSVRILDKFEMSQYFETIAGCELDGRRNTKAEVIEEALKRLGVTEEMKSQAVMIGDRKHDIIGAKKCGLDSIGIKVGYAEEGEFEAAGADHIFLTFEQLTDFLINN